MLCPKCGTEVEDVDAKWKRREANRRYYLRSHVSAKTGEMDSTSPPVNQAGIAGPGEIDNGVPWLRAVNEEGQREMREEERMGFQHPNLAKIIPLEVDGQTVTPSPKIEALGIIANQKITEKKVAFQPGSVIPQRGPRYVTDKMGRKLDTWDSQVEE